MAIVKRLNDTYTIKTNEVIVDGNLTVLGTQLTVQSTNTTIKDNVIVLNQGETGAGITQTTAGIQVNRGSLPAVSFLYDDLYDRWIFTNDGVNYANIAASTGTGFLSFVSDDLNPILGGNLDVRSYKIFSSTNNVKIDSNVQINHATVVPTTAVTGATLLYANAPGGGTTGLYVVNATAKNEELITKTRAFGLSLIL